MYILLLIGYGLVVDPETVVGWDGMYITSVGFKTG